MCVCGGGVFARERAGVCGGGGGGVARKCVYTVHECVYCFGDEDGCIPLC